MEWEQRFWEKVIIKEADECWLWTGCINAGGYGRFNTGENKILNAIRCSLFLKTNIWGKTACHIQECFNKSCVNPNHLYWGNHKTNTADSIALGTFKGFENRLKINNQKITDSDLAILRQDYSSRVFAYGEKGKYWKEQAKKYKMSAHQIEILARNYER